MTLANTRLFGRLSATQRAAVEQAADRRRCRAGEVLCRKGDAGHACLVIVNGGVHVQTDRSEGGHTHRVFLGPGQILGEMSLLSGSPVTATVVATVDTEVYAIPRRTFLALVDSEPGLRDALFELLIERMRHRETLASQGEGLPCTLLVAPPDLPGCDRLCEILFRAVEHYAPGSLFVDARGTSAPSHGEPTAEFPDVLPPSENVTIRTASSRGPARVVTSEDPGWCGQLIENWRTGGDAGRVLCLLLPTAAAPALREQLRRDDLVLLLGAAGGADRSRDAGRVGLASVDHVCLGSVQGADPSGRWCFRASDTEVERDRAAEAAWDAARLPTIDWLARRITGREIGLALGAGAASGLAHLGVLQVLEEAGIAVDYPCGSSMGGVVALTYAKVGSAHRATEMCRELIGSNDKLRDLTWLPRSALLRGVKRRDVAREAMGATTFAEFQRPTAVVAADLVKGERFVFEDGSGRVAMLATSAIPGIFPPEPHDGRLLVDGGLVSRIPVDLLERRRCGLKIAVNVVPSPAQKEDDYVRLSGAFDRFFGLTNVIASSWGLLAWWHGASEGSQADILLEPQRGRHAGYDFDTIEAMIEAGRVATTEKLDMIRDAVSSLLRPGAP